MRLVSASCVLFLSFLPLHGAPEPGPGPWAEGVPAPTKAIGMMYNFPPLEPGKEQGPPTFFVRSAGAIGKSGAPIVLPRAYAEVLYEGELVVVIGKHVAKASLDEARAAILGYTCGMDGSPLVRDARGERDAPRSIAGKSADGIAPVGPVLVKELRPEGQDIILRLNGKEVERANTKGLIWDPVRLVSEISQTVALEPGDVIFTGARQAIPQMRVGDVVEVEISGIGTLRSPVVAQTFETALDRYVAQADPSYAWKVVSTSDRGDMKQIVVDLTSQTWRKAGEVDRTTWQHHLVVMKPAHVTSKTAFLFISGGKNRPEPPRGPDDLVGRLAAETGTIAVELKTIPNQPLIFNGDGKGRSEDDLIAYTWDQFLKTGDETWPARLPMVKGAVRAMDCVQELLRSEEGGRVEVEKFVVAGGSKRGWTTWCTAAVDRRVTAAIPIVIDVLNVAASMRHHVEAYGQYSAAVGDYHVQGIMQRQPDERLRRLYEIEDPFSYRGRLTMPKLVLNASGDEFFCPDSSQFYWDALSGEKSLRYVPNAPHSLKGTDAGDTIIAFYQMIVSGTPRPEYSWTFEKDGSIRVRTGAKPRAARVWAATNPEKRDFRFYAVGPIYASTAIEPQADGAYLGKVEAPAKGWTAFYVELDFESGGKLPLKLSTAVRVVPDVLPHAGIDPTKAPLEVFKR